MKPLFWTPEKRAALAGACARLPPGLSKRATLDALHTATASITGATWHQTRSAFERGRLGKQRVVRLTDELERAIRQMHASGYTGEEIVAIFASHNIRDAKGGDVSMSLVSKVLWFYWERPA